MSIGSRIKERRESLSMSREQLAKKIGVTTSAISNYENEVSSPKAGLLYAIFEALDCDANYLYQDDMNALQDVNATPDEMERLVKKYRALDDYAKGTVDIILDRECRRAQADGARIQSHTAPIIETSREEKPAVAKFPKAKKSRGMVEIKVYDQPAAAGLGNYLDDPAHHIEQYPDYIIPSKTDFGILISGDSMEPEIHNGSTAFVQACLTIDFGQIGIFILNGVSYCKKLEIDYDNHKVRLKSINKEYDDIIVGESDDLRTVGLVLGQWTPRKFE